MKFFPFAALLAISAAFLSCDGTTEVGDPMCKMVAKGNEIPDNIKKLDAYKNLDPSCKTEQKKLVVFHDFSTKDINWDYVYSHLPGYVSGSGQVSESARNSQGVAYYIVNDIEMTQAEYDVYKAEVERKKAEELSKSENDLDIPCVIEGTLAMLTDKEITDLKKKYDGLTISDYEEAFPDSGSETGKGGAGCGGK
ncbi:MAG: hypothetical protein LBC75_03215 [Fibromonadaceae bacterium]|nr:hypothetical protein [Fibromonadaceae bacterium]